MASYSVVIIANESEEVMQRVLGHYLAQPLERLYLFWDGPAAQAPAAADPRLELVLCDAAFWAKASGGLPASIEEKQDVVYRRAAAGCGSDWLLVVDADEFLIAPRPLGEILAAVPEEVEAVRLPNAEAVWGPGDRFGEAFASSYFRRPFPSRAFLPLRPLLYGRLGRLMHAGLAGHAHGKSALRPGRAYDRIGCHAPQRGGRPVARPAAELLPAPLPLIAHYDAVSLERWREKFRRRYSGDTLAANMRGQRQGQVEMIRRAAAQSDEAAARLCRGLYGLGRVQYAVLRLCGLAFRHRPFP
ncbi:glycosyltransferase family 2 protein [Poseidonocella sp. HB161398]|uniref:glycosyltransferase family 2 protein n=1 Tax=Poseidonocella sp. HB161398 TaxID=2320855 RepID=UPI00110847B9|nr:glycosyltransferase family 2 protein [Poseidonocella sp. HB161398]